MEYYRDIVFFVACFVVIALASKQIGQFFAKVKLPLISGFIFAGVIGGPFILDLIPKEAAKNLRFVDEISLAFIAFAAGSELYLKELRSRFKSIKWVTIGLVVSTFALGSLTIFVLSDFIPFMRSMSPKLRIVVAILAGAILVARSPSSAIAIVNELRAKGPFTQTALGVTIIMDVAVIILFAVNSSIADALITNLGFNLSFVTLLLVELVASLVIGCVLWKFLQLILSLGMNSAAKTAMTLLAGYGIFNLATVTGHFSHEYFHLEVSLKPLLICMIGGFLVANCGSYRDDFLKILHDVGPAIYIAFFTLTGASLQLDVLAKTWTIALALFAVRLVGIFIGSLAGGVLAGDPMRYNRISWMSYVTQAGVGLGLAKEVADEFPEWGSALATVIISVIVLNQLVGPPFFKWAIHIAGEAHTRAETPELDGTRNAIIFGLEGQSLALARQLRSHGWQVKLAHSETNHDEQFMTSDLNVHPIPNLTLETLKELGAEHAETIVCMLSDEENYQICELAYEHFGTENVVVRLNNLINYTRFRELGALIVDPTSAMVSLLDHFVRSPSAASLLLGMEENQDIVDLEVRNPDLHGVALRDLRLPLDTLILSVRRGEQTLTSHGYIRLEEGDWVTVTGTLKSLEEIMLRFSDQHSSMGYDPWRRKLDASGLRVKHVMRENVRAIPESAGIAEILNFIEHSKYNHFPVVDDKGRLKGLISFEEIRDVLFNESLGDLVIADDLAFENAPLLSPDDTLDQALLKFDDCGFGCLPVVDPYDPQKLVGLLEQRSVLRIYHEKERSSAEA